MANPTEIAESSYKWVNSNFVAIASFHKGNSTPRGLSFFLRRLYCVSPKMGIVLNWKQTKCSGIIQDVRSHLETITRMAMILYSAVVHGTLAQFHHFGNKIWQSAIKNLTIEFVLTFYIKKQTAMGYIKDIW